LKISIQYIIAYPIFKKENIEVKLLLEYNLTVPDTYVIIKSGDNEMDLRGKTALVTGGGTGIGAAITRRLVNDGAKVCITGRRPEKLQETVASLPEGTVIACPGDVSKSEDIKRIVAAALEIDGKLDILVNNAAIEAIGPVTSPDRLC